MKELAQRDGIKEMQSWDLPYYSEKLKKYKLLNVPAADNTIRLAPPLIVSYKEIDKSILIIKNWVMNINVG